jgi:Ni/Co efflux regulator RcnB
MKMKRTLLASAILVATLGISAQALAREANEAPRNEDRQADRREDRREDRQEDRVSDRNGDKHGDDRENGSDDRRRRDDG